MLARPLTALWPLFFTLFQSVQTGSPRQKTTGPTTIYRSSLMFFQSVQTGLFWHKRPTRPLRCGRAFSVRAESFLPAKNIRPDHYAAVGPFQSVQKAFFRQKTSGPTTTLRSGLFSPCRKLSSGKKHQARPLRSGRAFSVRAESFLPAKNIRPDHYAAVGPDVFQLRKVFFTD